jgi:hypothetical protein
MHTGRLGFATIAYDVNFREVLLCTMHGTMAFRLLSRYLALIKYI